MGDKGVYGDEGEGGVEFGGKITGLLLDISCGSGSGSQCLMIQ